jgi:hypothetical protein
VVVAQGETNHRPSTPLPIRRANPFWSVGGWSWLEAQRGLTRGGVVTAGGVDGRQSTRSPLVRSWFAWCSPQPRCPLLNATCVRLGFFFFGVLAQLVELPVEFAIRRAAPTYGILQVQHLKTPVRGPCVVRSNLSPPASVGLIMMSVPISVDI